MKLVVLAGAKKDAAVPLKKEKFVIGRAKECSLRAGSDAISRRHCEITQATTGVTVRDLGSRNGTYVNDQLIEGETPLSHGDLLRVGPLEFRFESEGLIKDVKRPKVEGVGEAVARSVERAASDNGPKNFEDSISDWLLDGPADSAHAVTETMTFRADDTKEVAEQAAAELSDEGEVGDGAAADSETAELSEEEAKKKKEPGKLPRELLEKNKAKDSREAAANVLRDMARRR